MGYAPALEKAWSDLRSLTDERRLQLKVLSDTYDIDIDSKTILSLSCNIPAKDNVSLIILHYLIKKNGSTPLPNPTGEWIDFNSLEVGEAYYPAFKKRTIDYLIRKYSSADDMKVIVYPFEEVPIMISTGKADEEFGPSADILFDKTISKIFCTEDVVVLTDIVIRSLPGEPKI